MVGKHCTVLSASDSLRGLKSWEITQKNSYMQMKKRREEITAERGPFILEPSKSKNTAPEKNIIILQKD